MFASSYVSVDESEDIFLCDSNGWKREKSGFSSTVYEQDDGEEGVTELQ